MPMNTMFETRSGPLAEVAVPSSSFAASPSPGPSASAPSAVSPAPGISDVGASASSPAAMTWVARPTCSTTPAAGQALRPGGAERAVHSASALAGHAQGDPVAVAHEHGFDEGSVEEAPEEFDRVTVLGPQTADLGEQVREEPLLDLAAKILRQVR